MMRGFKQMLLGGAVLLAGLGTTAGAETIAIQGATLVNGSGVSTPDATIIIKDGIVTAAAPGAAVPAGATLVGGKGKVVTPGLFVSSSDIGIEEVSAVKETNDSNAANPRISVAYDPSYAVNPASSLIPLARAGGITRAVVMPAVAFGDGAHIHDGETAGHVDEPLFQGQPALIHLGAAPDIVVKPRLGVALPFGESAASSAGGSRALSVAILKAALEDVRHYAANKGAFNQGGTREYSLSRLDLEALLPVVRGEAPLFLAVHRAADIRLALRLAREEKLRLVLMGAEEGWMVAGEIAAAGVPVIIKPTTNLPGRFETQHARLDNAALLEKAGVVVILTGSADGHYANQVRFQAGTAVAYGMPRDKALAAITGRPAALFGGTGSAGQIAVGKPADLVLWGGDPLEPMVLAERVFINGVEQSLKTRQRALEERYLKR
ncbi:amidohydrolase family protein [Niveispirillum sp. BGYR6]|uniref:amidohydrolase family protein n=1 Tax=Niveispirillum sp. BGYR6 TaxID=2971249 RepID=UPI0022B978D6|nr:amidohydrolase family protein [Niveispirillum sp. BGYR6]MDG5494744.1 amidohydrolase family protein [Niveispirillum sp. BGYR6]